MPEKVLVVNEENQQQILKELSLKGFSINQTGFTELAHKAQTMLDGMDNETTYHYLEEIFANDLVYQARIRTDNGRVLKFFRQGYQETAEGNIELTGTPTQVKREVAYTVIPQTNKKGSRTKFNNKKEIETMAEKCTDCVKKLTDSLIANKALGWGEDHREYLESQPEENLEIMNNQVVPEEKKKEVQVNTAAPVAMTKEAILETLGLKTADDFYAFMPEALREQMKAGQDLMANQRAVAVTAIIANTAEGVWTKEGLDAMPLATLTSVYKSCKIEVNKKETPVVDFSGLGVGEFVPEIEVNAEASEGAMMPMGFEEVKETKKD